MRFVADKNITGICAETGEFLYSDDNSHSTWGAAYPLDTGWNQGVTASADKPGDVLSQPRRLEQARVLGENTLNYASFLSSR